MSSLLFNSVERHLDYGRHQYAYQLVRQARKTLKLTVYPSLKIVLYCPDDYKQEKIDRFLKRKAIWLSKQLQDIQRLQRLSEPKSYVSGESFLYLGRQYKLIVEEVDSELAERVKFEHGRIMLYSSHSSRNKQLLENWYQVRAEHILKQRYKEMLKKFDYDFVPELALRKMTKRWGSFLSQKKVLLNPKLIKASKECIDYVIIHELCHMKYQNHSKAYYDFLTLKCPNWKQLSDELEIRFVVE